MKIKYILYILLMLPFFSACNEEDDVDAIFNSGTWYLQNFYVSGWDKKDINASIPKYTPSSNQSTIELLQSFTILFKSDGTFTAQTNNRDISGKWSADGKSRSINMSFVGTPNVTGVAKEFYDALSNAKYYDGTSGFNGFMRFTQDKKSYIQLSHFPPN